MRNADWGDDISNDVITLGTCFSILVYIRSCFRFALIGEKLTAQSTGAPRRACLQASFWINLIFCRFLKM